MKTFYWLVKREFWEHKGGFVWAPIVSGIIFVAVTIMALITGEVFRFRSRFGDFAINGAQVQEHMSSQDLANFGMAIDAGLYVIAGIILGVTAIAAFFYCLGSLYDERRDRSILFWKSLPQSDTETVLSKVASGMLIAPAIAMVVGVVTGIILLGILALVAAFHGANLLQLLAQSHPLRITMNLILLVPLYAIWALPTVGWLMLCSAWARSKPFLWAIALPVGAGVILWWITLLGALRLDMSWYWQNVVGRMLGSLLPGIWLRHGSPLTDVSSDDPASLLSLAFHYSSLAAPTAWIGAIAGIVMIAGAIWFRRWRDDS